MTEQCNHCRFWLVDEKTKDPNDVDWACGACRHQPPVVIQPIAALLMSAPRYGEQIDPELSSTELYTASKHPATWANDWCGRLELIGGAA